MDRSLQESSSFVIQIIGDVSVYNGPATVEGSIWRGVGGVGCQVRAREGGGGGGRETQRESF